MDRAASDAPRATAALRNSGFVPVLEPQYTQTDANGPELCGDNSARGEPAVVAIEAVMTVGFGYPPSSRPSPRERSARPRLAAIGEKMLENMFRGEGITSENDESGVTGPQISSYVIHMNS
jgi:hypothetical protein